MNPSLIVSFALLVAGAAIFLAQLWLQLWEPETFLKLMATDGVLLAIAVVTAFVLREQRETRRLRDKRGLD